MSEGFWREPFIRPDEAGIRVRFEPSVDREDGYDPVEAQWVGDERKEIMLSMECFSKKVLVGETVDYLGLKLVVMDVAFNFGGFVVMLDERATWFWRLTYRTKRLATKINYRILQTLWIWGLSNTPAAQVLSWEDVWPWRLWFQRKDR